VGAGAVAAGRTLRGVLRASDVTFVIPTIPGRGQLLTRALASATALRHPAADIVVVEDRNREGAHWARNTGLAQVRTELVAWLDDDDEVEENHLHVLCRAMHQQKADLVFSYPEFVGGRDPLACCQNGKLIQSPINVPFGYEQQMHLDSRRFEWHPTCGYLTGNFIPITYLVRTELVRRVGGFPAPYSMPEVGTSGECEDYLLLLRLLDAGARFYHAPTVTWRYHFHEDNTGGRGADRLHELGQQQ
jgi:glycosyltransferase involved in cell wall biosynthesis